MNSRRFSSLAVVSLRRPFASNGQTIWRSKYSRKFNIFRFFSTESNKSYQYDENVDLRTNILRASLRYVKEHGWTEYSLVEGAKDTNMHFTEVGMLDAGPIDLVHHFLTEKRVKVKELVSLQENQSHPNESMNNNLFRAISTHIDIINPYRTTWPSAIALLLDPRHAWTSLMILYETIDDLCYLSNSQAVTFDWYYERSLLLIIYTITELYMLTDESPDSLETKEFLARLLESYQTIKSSPTAIDTVNQLIQKLLYQFGRNTSR